jgi:ssDNA thymidine ADP-ribosyltransferase, DarT
MSDLCGVFVKPLYREIKERFQLPPAYHMTHFANLELIFNGGALLAKNKLSNLNIYDISNPSIQAWRSQKIIPVSGRSIHDLNEKIVFLRFSLDILRQPGVIVSDGNARSNSTNNGWYFGSEGER